MARETVRPRTPKKKKAKLLKWAVGIACGYILISFVQLQADIRAVEEKARDIAQQCEDQRIYNEQVQDILSRKNDEEYIERIAREKLGYAYPDERVYIDISGI